MQMSYAMLKTVYFDVLQQLLRGHVNKKINKKWVGGSSVQLEIKKNWNIYFYTLFYYVFGREFERQFWIEGWVGCIVSKLVLDFYLFFIFTRPLSNILLPLMTDIIF